MATPEDSTAVGNIGPQVIAARRRSDVLASVNRIVQFPHLESSLNTPAIITTRLPRHVLSCMVAGRADSNSFTALAIDELTGTAAKAR